MVFFYIHFHTIHALGISSFLYLCGCCAAVVVSVSVIEKELLFFYLFITVPSIIASSFLVGQYCLKICSNSPSCVAIPVLYAFSSCRYESSCVTACIYSMDVHTGIFTEVLMSLTFILIPAISRSLFPSWLLWDSQSMIYKSGSGLLYMCTVYWCICSIIHCRYWNSMATALLSNAINGLWSVMMHTSFAK